MLKFTCCDAQAQFSGRVQAQVLQGIQRGYEKECLRVDPAGHLAQTPHPAALGSKLTHPWITTDYSEALLEFITPPSKDPAFPLQFLRDIHRFTTPRLGTETMWASSMPCLLGDDSNIPLADYGSSNKAKFKYVYREGLGLRYGRQMQTIAGVHYNWSLPEAFWEALHGCCESQDSLPNFTSARYFGLIRNFLRYGWLVPYLFGASPAICQSFLQGRKSDLQELVPGTLYGPYATSLRMSDLGYQNSAQTKLHVSFNSLPEYTDALEAAIRTPDEGFRSIDDVQHEKEQVLIDLALGTVKNDGADVVILAGAPLAGLANTIRDRVPVPLVDGIQAAVTMAEGLVRLNPRKATQGTYRRPAAKDSKGLSPALADVIGHRGS